jgi:hypothetical protein
MSNQRWRLLLLATALVAGCATPAGGLVPPTSTGPTIGPTSAATPSFTDVAVATEPPASPPPSATPTPSPLVLAAARSEPALKPLWRTAGPTIHESWTWEPAIDPTGRIWAASSFDDSFWIIDRDGRYLESFGVSGSGDGQFHLADQDNGFGAIAFRRDGGFDVADTGNWRVEQFDRNRTFIRAWGSFGTGNGQFTDPLDIATDGADNVYVFSDGRQDVQEFGPDGTFIRIAASGVGPYIAVATDGSLYAVVDDPTPSLRVYAPDGRRVRTIDLRNLVTFATGVAVTNDGRILVASAKTGGANPTYENLVELAADGHLLHLWPSGAEGIAVSPSGDRLYAAYSNVSPVVAAFALPAN